MVCGRRTRGAGTCDVGWRSQSVSHWQELCPRHLPQPPPVRLRDKIQDVQLNLNLR